MKTKTNRTLRKILSIALCLALVMSYVPMMSLTAYASLTTGVAPFQVTVTVKHNICGKADCSISTVNRVSHSVNGATWTYQIKVDWFCSTCYKNYTTTFSDIAVTCNDCELGTPATTVTKSNSDCTINFTFSRNAKAHGSSYITTIPATCTSTGEKRVVNCYYCSLTKTLETYPIDPDNHTGTLSEGVYTCCGAYQPAVDSDNDGYYEIYNASQLFWFAKQVNEVDRTANAKLMNDIDLENRPWTPIGSTGEENNNFRGIFDGQNHTIKGLYVEGGRAGLGFFGEVRTGTVKNFTIYGEVVVNTEVDYVGGVIGSICGLNGENDLERNGAIIQNITSYVNLTAKTHGIGMIGGFVGYANHESLIENCSWYGTFDAGDYRVDSGAGGFIGKIQENTSRVTIRNCGAYGTIKTNYAKNSYNNTATIYMGGFLSFSNTDAQTAIENCLFAGKFERGENLTDEARLGAFGTLRSVNAIKNCYYLGDDGLEAVHSDSDLKPGENIEITSVTGEQLKSGEVAYLLGEAWGQMSNTEGSLPIITDNEVYKVVTVGETGNYSVANVGDTNGDGTVDVTDYQALVNMAVSVGHSQTETASYDDIVKYDLNGDGYVDALDAQVMNLVINDMATVDVYAVGDYDLNGIAFEEADIKAIKHAIGNPTKLSTAEKYACDINGDGRVSETDLSELTAIYGEIDSEAHTFLGGKCKICGLNELNIADISKTVYFNDNDNKLDLSTLFTLPDGAGNVTYELLSGEGTLDGSTLNIVLQGTEKIKVTVAETETYSADEFEITVTVEAPKGSGSFDGEWVTIGF